MGKGLEWTLVQERRNGGGEVKYGSFDHVNCINRKIG